MIVSDFCLSLLFEEVLAIAVNRRRVKVECSEIAFKQLLIALLFYLVDESLQVTELETEFREKISFADVELFECVDLLLVRRKQIVDQLEGEASQRVCLNHACDYQSQFKGIVVEL